MVAPPKPAKWVTFNEAEMIICDQTGCDSFKARPALEEALTEGDVGSRKQISDQANPIELHPAYWTDEDRVMADRNNRTVTFEVHRGDLLRWLSPSADTATPRRGRPFKWDWDAFWVEVALVADTLDGLPKKQADLERHMADWFERIHGGAPSESQIREKAKRLYSAKRAKADK